MDAMLRREVQLEDIRTHLLYGGVSTIPNVNKLVILLIFEALLIQMQPKFVTYLKMWSKSTSIIKCIILGPCPLEDVLNLVVDLGQGLHK